MHQQKPKHIKLNDELNLHIQQKLALRTKNKTAKETNSAILRLLKHMKQHVMTLTFDNGREFCWHSELAKQLECETYFAKPYHSWERGLNAK